MFRAVATAAFCLAATILFCLAVPAPPDGRADSITPPEKRAEEGPEGPADKGASFSAMQVTGRPDTPRAGDYGTCWAAAERDGGRVWIEVTYARRAIPQQLWVYENCAPGSLYQVTAVDDGEERLLWRGVDPTPRIQPKGISKIPLKTAQRLNRFRLYFNMKAIAGWNEIDAIGMLDEQQRMQWADHARASSVYGAGEKVRFVDPFADPREQFIEEMRDLKQQLKQEWNVLQSLQQQVATRERKFNELNQRLEALIQQHQRVQQIR